MKNVSITIGIAAHNEEQNIKYLLESIFAQKIRGGEIDKIYVVSDNSSDKTNEIVKNMKNKLISLEVNAKRLGKSLILNKLFAKINSDLIIVLDADIIPLTNQFVQEILNSYSTTKNVGLVAVNIESTKGETFFEKAIEISHSFKNRLYKKSKDNIYLCHGRARAFSKNLYKKIVFPNDVPEDAYSYLICKKEKLKFIFNQNATVIFRSPKGYIDHFKQSVRFQSSKKQLYKYFSKRYIDLNYKINFFEIFTNFFYYMRKYPLFISYYVLISFIISLHSKLSSYRAAHSTWDISVSSKRIIHL